MKKIDISTPKHPKTFALVDDEDYEELNAHKWSAVTFPGNRTIYATRGVNGTQIRMHRYLLGFPSKDVDHRDTNGLNNQKNNLRECSFTENMANRPLNKNNSSGYKGVYWNTGVKKWVARTGTQGGVYLGVFTCIIKAAKAYDVKAKEMYGEFARLNFPDGVI